MTYYSLEDIFHDYGQFDAPVELTFADGSESFKKYGRMLYGTFTYTSDERKALQKVIEAKPIKHTDGKSRFSPSDVLKEVDENLKIDLDKDGVLNTDIILIRSLNLPRTNRYTTEGVRQIQNQIVVEFDPGGLTVDQMKVGYLRMRVNAKSPLIKEEWEQYCGLELFHNSKRLGEVMARGVVPKDVDEKRIRCYFLETKFLHSKLTDEEQNELDGLVTEQAKAKAKSLFAELRKSHENMKDLAVQYGEYLPKIAAIAVDFETETILPYQFPIWWNLERFLHIYLRHVTETNVGDRFAGKSLFKYSFRDVRRIVSAVIKQEYEAIEKHFLTDKNSGNFRRQGRRAVYHDGVYYRFEIDPTGLVVVFHPEEDIKAEP
jgi:hypothetical protein